MFGGLELKGAGSSLERKEKPKTDASAPTPAAASSSFSFLNTTPSPPPAAAAPPAAAPSGFSFLSSTAAAPPPSEVTVPASSAPTSSVFDFMTSSAATTATPASLSSPTQVPHRIRTSSQEGNIEHERVPIPEVSTVTSFSFLDGVGASTAGSIQPHVAALGGGGLGATTTTTDSATVISGLSRDPSFELPQSSSMSEPSPPPQLPTATPLPLAGAGITFGPSGTVTQPTRVVKKRNRTARIGAAANATAAPVSLPAPAATLPPRPPQEVGAASAAAAVSRESALEATKRAEEFLSAKLKEQSQSQFQPVTGGRNPSITSSGASSPSANDMELDVVDEDSVVAAARAAAEQAQQLQQTHMQQQGHHKPPSYFGSLFRSRASPPAQPEGLSYSSNHSSSGHLSATASPAKQDRAVATSTSAVDRLQREQEEANRAAAERQLRMMQQQHTVLPATQPTTATQRSSSYNLTTTEKPTPPLDIVPPPSLKKAVSAPAPKFPVLTTTISSGSAVQQATPQPDIPQPKTPHEVFQELQHQFRDKVVAAMIQVTKLRQHRSGLLEERFVTLAKERLASQQKAHAELQQLAAAEHEEYETADRMSQLMEAHEQERIELAAVLNNIQLALQELDDQKEHVVKGVTECFVEMHQQLQQFQTEQESHETQSDAESMKLFATLSKQLSVENERLQHDLKHIERDAALVAEERKELEAAISDQAGEYERLRDECTSKLKTVESEIEELRRLLLEKQRVAAQLRTEAAGHDESVLKVRVKFSRQLQRVQKKESTIQDNREEWELEKKTYEAHREQHEKKVREHSEALLAREQLLEALGKELEMVTTFEEIVAKEIGLGIMTNDNDATVDGDLAQLQADVVKTEAAVAEAKEILKVASSALFSLQEEVEGLEARIPILEQIKTEAAARRDFKGAGKASKEIKEATARLKECKEDLLDEAVARQRSAEEEVKQREQELEAKRSVAQEQEREQSAAAMQRLADNIRRLVATKKSVCGDAKPESIQDVGAYVLDSQIAALQYEGETYGQKYGGWDELMAEIGLEKSTSTKKSVTPDEDGGATDELSKDPDRSPSSDEVDQPHDTEAGTPVEPTISKEESLTKYRDLLKRLKEMEDLIEKAVNEENYDEAAELDKVLQDLMSEVDGLNLTDEEMEAVMSEADSGESNDADDVAEEQGAAAESTSDAPAAAADVVEDEGPLTDESAPQQASEEAPADATNTEDDVAGDSVDGANGDHPLASDGGADVSPSEADPFDKTGCKATNNGRHDHLHDSVSNGEADKEGTSHIESDDPPTAQTQVDDVNEDTDGDSNL